MKVIDAFWEKRNLGVDTVEFVAEKNDAAEDIYRIITSSEKGYNTIKLPGERPDLNCLMNELGYTYIETSFHLTHNLREPVLNPVQKRMTDCVSYAKMDNDDIDTLFAEIAKGMFITDRIALNPRFGIEIANKRYINWIKDELQCGTELFKLIYKNDAIGFFTFKETEKGVYYPFLAGMYEKYNKSGLGINIVLKPLREARERSGRMCSTYVVSNNLNSLTANLELGYKIQSFNNIFYKNNEV